MNRENKIAEPSGRVGSMAVSTGCQIFNTSSRIPLHGVSSNIDEWSSAFDHGEHAGDEFVAHDIDSGHLGFSVGQPPGVVLSHLRVAMDGTHRGQMEHSFHLLVCHGTDLRFPAYTRTGLILKRRCAGITGEFTPIVEPGEVMSVHDQVAGYDQSDAFDAGHEFKSGP